MIEPNFDLTTIRLFLHLMAVTVWVGGQIVMMAILPALKSAGVDGHPAMVAKAFNAIAWPAMAVAIFTGVWNLLAVGETSSAWGATFGIKFLFVLASGFGALRHQKAEDPKQKALFGAIGFGAAVIATFLGVAL